MPEGHTIRRQAKEFAADFAGDKVVVTSPQGRFEAGAALLDGQELVRAEAAGKHLFLRFGNGRYLHVHLGLIGKWTFGPTPAPEPVGAVRVRLEGPRAWADLRGATLCEVVTPAQVRDVLARLGPDPLRRDGRREEFVRRVGRRVLPIAALLMDQAVIAGVGNVYRAEVLFRHRLSPDVPGRDLDPEIAGVLWDDLSVLMRDGVKRGVDRHDAAGRPAAGHPARRAAAGGRALRLPAHGGAVPRLRHPGRDPRAERPQPVLVPGLPGVAHSSGLREQGQLHAVRGLQADVRVLPRGHDRPAEHRRAGRLQALRGLGAVRHLQRHAHRRRHAPPHLDAVHVAGLRLVQQLDRRAAGAEHDDPAALLLELGDLRQAQRVAPERERRPEILDGQREPQLADGPVLRLLRLGLCFLRLGLCFLRLGHDATVCEGGRVTTTGSAGLLLDSFDRIHEVVHHTVDGLSADHLTHRPDGRGNSIAWLVWHLTRIQDDHVAEVAGTEQVWTAKGYAADFGLPFDAADTGYGHGPEDVAAVRVSAEQLTAYLDAVHEATRTYVATLADGDLDEDRRRALGPAGHARRPPRQRRQRRPPARRPGGLRARAHRRFLIRSRT